MVQRPLNIPNMVLINWYTKSPIITIGYSCVHVTKLLQRILTDWCMLAALQLVSRVLMLTNLIIDLTNS